MGKSPHDTILKWDPFYPKPDRKEATWVRSTSTKSQIKLKQKQKQNNKPLDKVKKHRTLARI